MVGNLPSRGPIRDASAGNTDYPSSAMVFIDTDFSGFNAFMKNLERYQVEAVADALDEGLEETLDVAKSLVPYRTGKLQDTAYKDIARGYWTGGVSGAVVFSAENPRDSYNYAYVQEVRDDWSHIPGRQSRYLQEAWERTESDVYRLVKRALNRANRQAAAEANRAAAANIKTAARPSQRSLGQKLKKLPIFGKFFGGGKK